LPRRRLSRIRHPSGTTGADQPKLGTEDLKRLGFRTSEHADERYIRAMATGRGVQLWLLLAVVAVLSQQVLTIYPDSQRGAGVFWAALSLLLLWFVHRRSNVARAVFAMIAAMGFAIFVLAAISDLTRTSALLAMLYGVQTGTMLVRPVRAWTQAEPAGRVVSPTE
jgi:hypothetical protein